MTGLCYHRKKYINAREAIENVTVEKSILELPRNDSKIRNTYAKLLAIIGT